MTRGAEEGHPLLSKDPNDMQPPSPTSISRSSKYSFDPAIFAQANFEPSTFLAAAKDVTPLEVLREHLRGYERDLKEDLYDVINRDLADYLHLSSKLAGVEDDVADIKAPLQELSSLLQDAKAFVSTASGELRGKLEERRALRQRREVLERRTSFILTLRDVEGILRVGAGEEGIAAGGKRGHGAVAGGKGGSSSYSRRLLPNVETTSASPEEMLGHCGILERAAHAWLSLTADLRYFDDEESSGKVVKAAAGLSTQMDLRLLKIEKALLGHLASERGSGVSSLRVIICPKNLTIAAAAAAAASTTTTTTAPNKGEKEQKEEEIEINEAALKHVWRSFCTMGRGAEVEKQVARLLMLPFIDLNFTQGRLDGGSRGSCAGLGDIYKGCLSHIKKNLGATLRCSEETSASLRQHHESQGPPSIDLIANGVWKPLQQALSSRLGSIFAPGIASILHSNYIISMDFLKALSAVCGSKYQPAIRRRLQAHPSTQEFHGRWNLPVYFHLRFSEISNTVDGALSKAEAGQPSGQPRRADTLFVQSIFDDVTTALEASWTREVFLYPLMPRFFRFTLQIITRFHAWLAKELSTKATNLTADKVEELVVWVWDSHVFSTQVAAHDLHHKILAALLQQHQDDDHDDNKEKRLEKGRLHDAGVVVAGDGGGDAAAGEVMRAGLTDALVPFAKTIEKAWAGIEAQVIEQSVERLQAVRGITATYRMTNKKPPERPSPFLPKILEPIRLLESSLDGRIPPSLAQGWRSRVAGPVCERYLALITELLSSVDQMEDALKKRKQRTAAKGGMTAVSSEAGQQPQGLSDAEKIKLQLLLDCVAFAAELQTVAGVTALECEPYRHLLRAVAPALPCVNKSELKMDFPPQIEAYLQPPSSS